jgi:hypothetical protein
MIRRVLALGLTAWLAGAALADGPRPPEALFFGLPTPQQRLALTPPLTASSGRLRLELVEIDRYQHEGLGSCRLLLRCQAEEGELPADLALVEPPYAAATGCGLVPVGSEAVVRRRGRDGDEAWLALTVAGDVQVLEALGLTVGRRPGAVERTARLALDPLGAPVALPEFNLAIEPTLLRRETARLNLAPPGPPYYTGLDSTLGLAASEAPAVGPYLTLRLHTLAPAAAADGWRLSNLRLTGADGAVVDDWRYLRLEWRPDWGGALGVTGSDAEGGVKLDSLTPDGPAARAGLQAGDLVTAAGDLNAPDAFTLGDRVRHSLPGSRLRLSLTRAGRPLSVTVTLGRGALWPDRDEAELQAAWAGLAALRPATADSDILAAWDWQTRAGLPAGFEPKALELVLTRAEPAHGTTFLLRHVPLTAPR